MYRLPKSNHQLRANLRSPTKSYCSFYFLFVLHLSFTSHIQSSKLQDSQNTKKEQRNKIVLSFQVPLLWAFCIITSLDYNFLILMLLCKLLSKHGYLSNYMIWFKVTGNISFTILIEREKFKMRGCSNGYFHFDVWIGSVSSI